MDQLKDILRQCVKYRFWIAFGISLILPMIGYFVGVGGIIQAKDTQEKAIKTAKADIGKYTTRGIVNGQYQPLAAQKNAILTQDVDDSWRKLRAIQEPLLKWPEEVEAKFLRWGRKFPTDVDKGEVTRTLVDYTFAYPNFVNKLYGIFKPFNYEDGTGIVVAPDAASLLRPATYSSDNPPDLSKVWAEQERIWVVTAVLDAIARINDGVKAKDWDGAVVKQINLLEVGSPGDLDQVSIATGTALVPADTLEGTPPSTAAAAPAGPGAPAASTGGGPGGNAPAAGEVYYLKNDSKQYKTLPIKLAVLVDQNKLPEFLVGLENSPITIQVMETEVARPAGPVSKPMMGDKSSNQGGFGGRPGEGLGGPVGLAGGGGAMGRNMNRGAGIAKSGGPGGMPGPGGMAGPAGGGSQGNNNRGGVNKAQQRKDENKKNDTKAEAKAKADQFFNIVEVTVYGQARFYLAPPPPPAASPSTAAAPAPAAPTAAPAAPTGDAAKKDEAPKAEATKTDAAPKAEPEAPKGDAPKAGSTKGEGPEPRS
jgi:hypothetical protein